MKEGSGGRRMALTFCDQGVSSLSNFAVGMAIARLAGPAEFGAYMLTYTLWLVVVGCHRAIVTEPIIVSSRDTDDPVKLARGVTAELLLGATVSVIALCGGLTARALHNTIATPMLAMAPWFAFLLLQDYWRAMAFKRRRPGLALLNDSCFAVVQVAFIGLFWLLGWRSVASMITAWGIGATAGAILGMAGTRSVPRPSEGRRLVADLWPLSRWMLADFMSGFIADQAYVIFVAILLSATDYGGFRAAFNLMGPAYLILLAGGNIGLPEASRRTSSDDWTELRRFARGATTWATVGIVAYGLVVAVAGGRLLSLVYGPQFARFGPLATLAALQYALIALVFGQGIALKAAGRMRRLWRIRVVVCAISLASVVVLVHWLGTAGAAWGGVATGCCYGAALYWVYDGELGRSRGSGPTTRLPAVEELG